MAFARVNQTINMEVTQGWLVRSLHAGGASWLFIWVYAHIVKGILNRSWRLTGRWLRGIIVLLVLMTTAFLGYGLVANQMSQWGGVVISGLLGVLHPSVVTWLWGSFIFRTNALGLFFILHFILPFVMAILVFLHLIQLHKYRRTNSLGLPSRSERILFYPLYWCKDAINLGIYLSFVLFITLWPNLLREPLRFEEAEPLISPEHITPEWYFCLSYAVLRRVPNKTLGVVGLVFSILGLTVLRLGPKGYPVFGILNKILVMRFLVTASMLFWLGVQPPTTPFRRLGGFLRVTYFTLLFLIAVQRGGFKFLFSPK